MSQAPIIRITHDGAQRVTADIDEGGALRITGFHDVPEFDVDAVIHAHFPGIVVQANLVEAIAAWLIGHGAVTDADVPAILAAANALLASQVVPPWLPTAQADYALVPYPSGMLRFPDSNSASDGWSIVKDEKVMRGGSEGREGDRGDGVGPQEAARP
jgi:hypothetical protein